MLRAWEGIRVVQEGFSLSHFPWVLNSPTANICWQRRFLSCEVMAGGVFFTFAESSPRVLGLIAVPDVLEELELSFGV